GPRDQLCGERFRRADTCEQCKQRSRVNAAAHSRPVMPGEYRPDGSMFYGFGLGGAGRGAVLPPVNAGLNVLMAWGVACVPVIAVNGATPPAISCDTVRPYASRPESSRCRALATTATIADCGGAPSTISDASTDSGTTSWRPGNSVRSRVSPAGVDPARSAATAAASSLSDEGPRARRAMPRSFATPRTAIMILLSSAPLLIPSSALSTSGATGRPACATESATTAT